MNNVFKQSGQNRTTTGASLLIWNQSLMKKTHGQNNLSYIPLNILNKLTDSLKKKKKTATRVNTELRSIFFIEWIMRKTVFIVTSHICHIFIVNYYQYYFLSLLLSFFFIFVISFTVNTINTIWILFRYYFLLFAVN